MKLDPSEQRFQRRVTRTIELAEKLFTHSALSPKSALTHAEAFLKATREYALEQRCKHEGVPLQDCNEEQ